jgi:hypothetical protein
MELRRDWVILFGFPQQLHRLLNPAQRHEETPGKITVDNRIVSRNISPITKNLAG